MINPKVIVDLGAHVGFTSIYYSLIYESAIIFSIEASKKNYEFLSYNTKSFENIYTLQKVIYSKEGYVKFNEDNVFSYNNKINDSGKPTECITMNALMKYFEIEKIDLLKIDIEGAEAEILNTNNNWLNKVDNIIIELHRPYNIKELEKDLNKFGFEVKSPAEDKNIKNIFLTKKQ